MDLAKDPISGLWYRPHTWDLDSIRRDHDVARCIEPDDNVLDLGSHLGASARVAVEGGARHVTAVEPHPDSFAILSRNMEIEPIAILGKLWDRTLGEFVTPVRAAVAHTVLYENARSHIGHTTMEKPWTKTAKAIPVIGMTVAELVRQRTPDVILCDIEGAEYVVDWASQLPAKTRVLFMEFHFRFMPTWHAEATRLYDLFTRQMGFVASDPVPPLGMTHNSTHVFRRTVL